MITKQHDHQEDRLLLALQTFNNTPNAKIRSIAHLYDIRYITLAARLYDRQSRHEFRHPHYGLIPTEEVTLKQ